MFNYTKKSIEYPRYLAQFTRSNNVKKSLKTIEN